MPAPPGLGRGKRDWRGKAGMVSLELMYPDVERQVSKHSALPQPSPLGCLGQMLGQESLKIPERWLP